jgi:hypothetical protein
MRVSRESTAAIISRNRSARIICSSHARTLSRSGAYGEVIGGGVAIVSALDGLAVYKVIVLRSKMSILAVAIVDADERRSSRCPLR